MTDETVRVVRNMVAVIDLWDQRAAGKLTIAPLTFARGWAEANEAGRRMMLGLAGNPYRPEIEAYPIIGALLYVMSHKEYALYHTGAEKEAEEKQLQHVVDLGRAYVRRSKREEALHV